MPGSSLAVILDDHVMHDHTSLHHLPHLIMRPTSLHHLLRCVAEEDSGRRVLARDGKPQAVKRAARETGDTAELVRVEIRRRSAPVSTVAAMGWATREERRGERKAQEATG
jgi:hypothetical protein